MTSELSESFTLCRDALTRGELPRVWSLIVTIFGDLAQTPGARISGTVLGQITDPLGIKPEAMRVALHRLRRDGWLDSERSGRGSYHFLTDFGRTQSVGANDRIYGKPQGPVPEVHVLMAGDGDANGRRKLDAHLLTDTLLPLGSSAAIGLGPAPEDVDGLLVLTPSPDHLPAWLKSLIGPVETAQAYEHLMAAMDVIQGQLAHWSALPAEQKAALRCLLVHEWRRVVLRHPDFPEIFFPEGWPGLCCRHQVQDLLARMAVSPDLLLNRSSLET